MNSFNHPLLNYLRDKRFILASTSPRRLEIVQLLGIPNVEVIASNFEENLDKSIFTPQDYVVETALGKALAVRDELISKPGSQELPKVILSADTVVECDGRIFEKPKSVQDNIDFLKFFRDCGIPLQVMTGLIILVNETGTTNYNITKHLEVTSIIMDTEFSDELIELYCNTKEGFSVAGGFRIQGFGSLFMKEVRGDYYNVVGLPFRATFNLLQQALGISL